jgi:response regulator RpfG family c-di-GMP phosphodiesterase
MLTLDTGDPTGEKPFLRQFYAHEEADNPVDERLREMWMSMRHAINQGDEIDRFLSTVTDPIVLDDPANQVPTMYRDVVAQSGTRTVVIVPANWQGQMLGLLYFASYRPHAFDEQDVTLMQSVAAQLAPALQVASLRVEIEHSYQELKGAHTQALLRLAYAAEARDPYTECHLTRIKAIAQTIAQYMGIEGDELEAIGYGAIVHDLGKLRIPDSILCNPGTLSDDEWKEMKKHPEWGAEIIGGNAFYDVAREVAHCHHERWDGSGYPQGLSGEEIPLAARIVSVADVYDALTSARPYKHAWPVERALVELMRMRAKTLCPHAVDVFMLLWNDGTIARIDAETLDESLEVDFRAMFAA